MTKQLQNIFEKLVSEIESVGNFGAVSLELVIHNSNISKVVYQTTRKQIENRGKENDRLSNKI